MREEDRQRASLAVDLIESAAVSEAGLAGVFLPVAELLGARMIHLYNFTDMTSPGFVVAPECESFQKDYIVGGWHRLDTYSQRAAKVVLPGRVYSDRAFVSDEMRSRDPFFQEFCRKWEVGGFISCSFALSGQSWSVTMMPSSGPPQNPGQLDIYRSVVAAVNRACLVSAALRNSRAHGIAQGIERSGKGAIVLDHEGKAILITPSAEMLLGADLSVRGGRLASEGPGNDQLLQSISTVARDGHRRALRNFLLVRQDFSRPILVMPFYCENLKMGDLPGARIVLVLIDLDRRNSPVSEHLRLCFGLTVRECELAQRLSRGSTLKQCAQALGITENTVRQMMKAVLLKTNTHSQIELVALLLSI